MVLDHQPCKSKQIVCILYSARLYAWLTALPDESASSQPASQQQQDCAVFFFLPLSLKKFLLPPARISGKVRSTLDCFCFDHRRISLAISWPLHFWKHKFEEISRTMNRIGSWKVVKLVWWPFENRKKKQPPLNQKRRARTSETH